eukprot:CAMPEP_0172489756 /NCGR_PEP_ID=MMETSP1066-20121228/19962_1 /TAXON_ID=671091 /ORGANISM="Coscinodiscus wailesii, Strain CCMP2513" /LENGTH=862 /DNA_ID=CAMNT_0013257847 /DNA_START=239 /DNA_END=2827 /DNA_ORIENTATION=+
MQTRRQAYKLGQNCESQERSSTKQWTDQLKVLQKFMSQEGHCDLPQIYNKNPKLASWIKTQRYQYERLMNDEESTMTDERIQALENIGFEWSEALQSRFTPRRSKKQDSRSKRWMQRLEELKDFKSREGHCNVPQRYDDNPCLGTWVNTQRRQFRRFMNREESPMTRQRIEALERIGFEWRLDRFERWLVHYEELQGFKAKEGHCNVPEHSNEWESLGRWVAEQRRQYKLYKDGYPSPLSDERIAALQIIGFEWSTPQRVRSELYNDMWMKQYKRLQDYKSREGHCNVPQGYKKDPSLGKWVKSQRQFYKQLKDGSSSRMTHDRVEALERLGFEWSRAESLNRVTSGEKPDASNKVWMKQYEKLQDFKSREGHCNISQYGIADPYLSKWVKTQRHMYKLMMEGKSSGLTERRIEALKKLGFEWSRGDNLCRNEPDTKPNMYRKVWMKQYKKLKKFKSQEGHCNVPKHYSQDQSLGLWVSTQRNEYRKLMKNQESCMTEERIEALEKIDFVWSLTNEKEWMTHYEELKEFMSKRGNSDIGDLFKKNKLLGDWVKIQMQQYSLFKQGKPSCMSDKKKELLEEIACEWIRSKNPSGNASQKSESAPHQDNQSEEELWIKQYKKLKEFKLRKGHCNVCQYSNVHPNLAKWVKTQKKLHELMMEGKPSSMTKKRADALEKIGFQWRKAADDDDDWQLEQLDPRMDRYTKAWMERYNELKRFKAREGHCNVPRDHNGSQTLWHWAKTQRHMYNCMKDGKQSSMTLEKMEALDRIGFEWSLRYTASQKENFVKGWMKRYKELNDFKSREGHCNVSQRDHENLALGKWVKMQRYMYKLKMDGKQSSMTDERVEALERIGFEWNRYNQSYS